MKVLTSLKIHHDIHLRGACCKIRQGRVWLAVVLAISWVQVAQAQNMRVVDSRLGLASNYVMSLYQDSNGFLWAGTYTGLSVLGGNNGEVIYADRAEVRSLAGSMVLDIQGTEDEVLWIRSNMGLCRWDMKNHTFRRFVEIYGDNRLAVSPMEDVVVMTPTFGGFYYNKVEDRFRPLAIEHIDVDDCLAMIVDSTRTLTLITHKERIHYRLEQESGGVLTALQTGREPWSDGGLLFVQRDGSDLLVVTASGQVLRTDLSGKNGKLCFTLPEDAGRHGTVSGIAPWGDGYLVSYFQEGVFRYTSTDEGGCEETPTGVTCGVMAMMTDRRQDIVWVASDGKGLLSLTHSRFECQELPFSDLPFKVSSPVRAILRAANGDLLVGTKGDGLMVYQGFEPFDQNWDSRQVKRLTTANSALLDNSVYSFAQSAHGGVWIGTDGVGLNYYDPGSKHLYHIDVRHPMCQHIHAMAEADGTELYACANLGEGLFHIRLSWTNGVPQVREVRQLLYAKEMRPKPRFSSVSIYGDEVWLATRENGIVRMKRKDGSHRLYRFAPSRQDVENDAVCVNAAWPGFVYCGTSAGMFALQTSALSADTLVQTENIAELVSPADRCIRGLLCTADSQLWLSTSHSVFCYNVLTKEYHSLGSSSGLCVTEFGDGAAYWDERSDGKFFGGAEGLVVAREAKDDGLLRRDLLPPPIQFTDVRVGDEYVAARTDRKGRRVVNLRHNQNYFTVSYAAVDYLEGEDYLFSYRFDDASEWTRNGHSRNITFSSMPPGNYRLQVRYQRGVYVSEPYELVLHIAHPWYTSFWAKLLGSCLLALLIWYWIMRQRWRQRRRQLYAMEKLQQQHELESYESKLRFFTNLTHEFGAPLLLIGGPCQRILDSDASPMVKRYAGIIQHSVDRMNHLIQQLIEFRRIQTGHREYNAANENVSNLLDTLVSQCEFQAEEHGIEIVSQVGPDVTWPTDKHALTSIVFNLLSNALKYTPDNGTITVCLRREPEQLVLSVANTGKMIHPDELGRLFDRYVVLDRLENDDQRRKHRNGLGLAIAKGLADGMGGSIGVTSDEQQTTFTVVLPPMVVTEEHSQETPFVENFKANVHPAPQMELSLEPHLVSDEAPTVFIVDDDREILWLLMDVLGSTYNVYPFTSGEEALAEIGIKPPQLIACDVLMTGMSGIEVCKRVKDDPHLAHIPFMMFSSSSDEQTQVDSVNAGADVYLSKPFNVKYVQSVVDSLVNRNTRLKSYFDSSISSFELSNGKVLHHEDKELMDRLVAFIQENISNPEITPAFIAENMNIGLRNLYRKIKVISDMSLTTMIREIRLEYTRQMLIHTRLSMEEICYKSGFNNRSTFYKQFSAKFGCTPRQFHERMMAEAREVKKEDNKSD